MTEAPLLQPSDGPAGKPSSETPTSNTTSQAPQNPPHHTTAGPSTNHSLDNTAHQSAEEPHIDYEATTVPVAVEQVVQLLGSAVEIKYRRAVSLTSSAASELASGGYTKENGDKLEEATRLFVEMLSSVDEDKQAHSGFAELLLGYGKALVCFVERNGATHGVFGDALQKKGGSDQDEAAEEDVGDEDEDEDELAWTQLEAARVIFERCVKNGQSEKYRSRLGDVHATLGKLLLEADAWEGAAREFADAAKLLEDTPRYKAEVLYKRYLALRRDAAQEAVAALRDCITAFERTNDDITLRELRKELHNFEDAVGGAIRNLQKESGDNQKVVVVQPRKRPKIE